ncbi:MAG: cysteine synthase A [Akkermansia sp.]|nr:cysteine synthase A [Akkermansia sp.]
MMKAYTSVSGMVGKTPLFEPARYAAAHGLRARLLLKLEMKNPAGSVKDRVAMSIIADAEASGRLQPGGTIVEPTSGNTGIGLAAIGCARGYRVILTMPDTMSVERRNIVKAYGAEVVLTPGAAGMQGSVDKAEELALTIPGAIVAGQFSNPANPAAHYATTGPEIWADCEGQVDALVAGVGTGGTITGTGRYLKEQKPSVHVVAVQPAASPLLTGGPAGPHKIQGIGANFIPEALDCSVYDEVISVDNEVPMETARELGCLDGVLVGISGGAALWAATQLASRPEWEGKTIVVIMPDGADRYYSTDLFV